MENPTRATSSSHHARSSPGSSASALSTSSTAPIDSNAPLFLANHHRLHNPDDPKLKANPSFKARRRSALFGGVLKTKSKDHQHLHRLASRPSTANPGHRSVASTSSAYSNSVSSDIFAPASSIAQGLAVQPQPRSSSKGRRHSLGATHQDSARGSNELSDAIHHTPMPSSIPASKSLPQHPPSPDSSNGFVDDSNSTATALGQGTESSDNITSDSKRSSTPVFDMVPIVSPPVTPSQTDDTNHDVNRSTPSGHPSLTHSVTPTISRRVRSLRVGDSFSVNPPSSSADVTIIATPPTPRLPDPTERVSPASLEPAVGPEAAVSPDVAAAKLSELPKLNTNTPAARTSDELSMPRFRSSIASPARANVFLEPRDPKVGTSMSSSSSALITSPQRYSSLGRAALTQNGRGALASASAQDLTADLDLPAASRRDVGGKDRRMSMLDFLSADQSEAPQREDQIASTQQLRQPALPAQRRRSDGPSSVPASMPLMQASRRIHQNSIGRKAPELRTKMIDLSENVSLKVEPMGHHLTMFGSTQTSSNYSLAGTVVVEVPGQERGHYIIPTASDATRLDDNAADILRPETKRPSILVESLTVRFSGYSVYVDATGRFNGTKLVEVTQDLLQPEGCRCYLDLGSDEETTSQEQDTSSPAAANQPDPSTSKQRSLKYEIEFDLSVPGWLPASQRSRFGGTFYCVQTEAIIDGQKVVSHLSTSSGSSRGSLDLSSPSSAIEPTPFLSNRKTASPVTARSLEAELHSAVSDIGSIDRREGARVPASTRNRSKATWLEKTAKQLQLRTSKKSNTFDASNPANAEGRRGSGSSAVGQAITPRSHVHQKVSEASNELLPSGKRSIKSESISILIRRCRDVVPVPVARLAMLGTSSRSMISMDAQPSISQNLTAAASSAIDNTIFPTADPPEIIAPSLSVPVGLAAHPPRQAEAYIPEMASLSDPSSLSVPEDSMLPTQDSSTTASAAALAPSPVINDGPARFADDSRRSSNDDNPRGREAMMMLPPAPSAFDAPTDPAKLAAVTSSLSASSTLPNLPASLSRASALADPRFGNANSPPRTSSRATSTARSSAPMRHFLHRPVLHLPHELGISGDKGASGGLSFSLTLSLPSHVQVTGPKSDVLSFGVQIEVGKTADWDAVRKWGGLRLKDMELVCLQTERHSSMPSRSFCAAFPLPPPPNRVEAADLPIVSIDKSRASANSTESDKTYAEKRLRQGYDRELVLGHIDMVNEGKAPDPLENNVERVRTTIVGPPPSILRKPGSSATREGGPNGKGKGKVKAKDKEAPIRTSGQASPARSGANTPDGTHGSISRNSLRAAFAPAAQVGSGSGNSVMQPIPRSLSRSNNPSTTSLRQAFSSSSGATTLPARSRTSSTTNWSRPSMPFEGSPVSGPTDDQRPSPTLESSANGRLTPQESAASPTLGSLGSSNDLRRLALGADSSNSVGGPSAISGASSTGHLSGSVSTGPKPPNRRRRFENAINRLSTFASSMLDANLENHANNGVPQSPGEDGPGGAGNEASLRATYAFAGDDAQGVDLTKGRVRMTINLPLVSNDINIARKVGSGQLIPDFESPYVRIRHKLKVKLGFGLNSDAADRLGENWGQALVMCVPVRFTEAPPQEVQDQFDPTRVGTLVTGQSSRTNAVSTPTNGAADEGGRSGATEQSGTASSNTDVSAANTNAVSVAADDDIPRSAPLLPAYAQLFREDGSRLADEGEDLPRYPGRMSVIGEIDTEVASDSEFTGLPAVTEGVVETTGLAGTARSEEARGADVSGAFEATVDRISRSESTGTILASSSRIGEAKQAPTPMDRSTSLPGHRLLLRTASSGPIGLRASPSYPMMPSSSTENQYVHARGSSSGVGCSAFDPLPNRPTMRRRSATTTSMVSFSRIVPDEVVDEALASNAMEEEEDRRDHLQAGNLEDMEDDVEEMEDDNEMEEDEEAEEGGTGFGVNMALRMGSGGQDGRSSEEEFQADEGGLREIDFESNLHPAEREEGEVVQLGQAW